MRTRYYNNLYVIDDEKKCDKLIDLFNLSVKNDLNKWTQVISTRVSGNDSLDLINYYSPKYNDNIFTIEIAQDPKQNGRLYHGLLYINEKNPSITGCELQLFSSWDYFTSSNKKIRTSLDSLRDNVFEDNISKIEDALGGKNDRRDKLIALNIETYKNIIEDSYNDFIENQTESFARMVARTALGFNKNQHIPYSLWVEKFKGYKIVIREIEKLDNYDEKG